MKTLSLFFACLIFVSTTLEAANKSIQFVFLNEESSASELYVELPPQFTQEDTTIMIDGKEYTLRAGTAIVFEAAQTYNAKNISVGQTVMVRVKYNIVVNKNTLISAGALGAAIVSDIQKPKSFGRAGKMEIQLQTVQAVDGQQVQVSGIPMVYEGDDKKGMAWGIALGAGLFTSGVGLLAGFFIKGKNAEFRAGMSINASVASDTEVEVEKP